MIRLKRVSINANYSLCEPLFKARVEIYIEVWYVFGNSEVRGGILTLSEVKGKNLVCRIRHDVPYYLMTNFFFYPFY